jgi:hypothetical protein
MRVVSAALILSFVMGCNLLNQNKDKEGICVHSTTITTKTGSCAGSNASQRIATYCTDEKKEGDCKNLSVGCASTTLTEYEDATIYYEDKKCDSSGYTQSCPANSSYKVSTTAFCP